MLLPNMPITDLDRRSKTSRISRRCCPCWIYSSMCRALACGDSTTYCLHALDSRIVRLLDRPDSPAATPPFRQPAPDGLPPCGVRLRRPRSPRRHTPPGPASTSAVACVNLVGPSLSAPCRNPAFDPRHARGRRTWHWRCSVQLAGKKRQYRGLGGRYEMGWLRRRPLWLWLVVWVRMQWVASLEAGSSPAGHSPDCFYRSTGAQRGAELSYAHSQCDRCWHALHCSELRSGRRWSRSICRFDRIRVQPQLR